MALVTETTVAGEMLYFTTCILRAVGRQPRWSQLAGCIKTLSNRAGRPVCTAWRFQHGCIPHGGAGALNRLFPECIFALPAGLNATFSFRSTVSSIGCFRGDRSNHPARSTLRHGSDHYPLSFIGFV